jgi:hypothetical protein
MVSRIGWITNDKNTHSEYLILIVCSLQQWLNERASMLRYIPNACRVTYFGLISREEFSVTTGRMCHAF